MTKEIKKSSNGEKNKQTLKVGMISLGCAKNRVDSEIMLGLYNHVCGFKCVFPADSGKADEANHEEGYGEIRAFASKAESCPEVI